MSDRPRAKLRRIGELIDDSMDRGFLGLAREMVRVFEAWLPAVGEYNASKAQPESIKNGVLTVLVESPAWIDRFSYLRGEFVDRVNQELEAPLVQEIVFRVGRLPENPLPVRESGKEGGAVSGSGQTSPAAVTAASRVSDPDLRERLAAFLSRQRGRPKE